MSAITEIETEAAVPNDARLMASLDRLWAELPRLRSVGVAGDLAAGLGDHVSALRWLHHSGLDRPVLVGLVGGASCGKSTLFGSLVGRAISKIHYQPHSSLGPILWVHRRHRARVLPEASPRVFLPALTALELRAGAEASVGGVNDVAIAFHDDERWQQIGLLDLPDISSESARREGWLVRHLMPWLDLVVWMVDPNDYLFEDLYIDLIEDVATLGQRSIVVVNDIHGQAKVESPVLQERIARFRPDASFILPRLVCTAREPYPLFRNEPEFLKLRNYLQAHRALRPVAPLVARVRGDVAGVLHANAEWARLVRELSAGVTRLVARHRKRIVSSAPLLSVLPEAAQYELERLRSRFSLWHQGKRLYRAITSPARTVGQAAFRKLQLSIEDLDTEPLYRHLIGSLKEFGVELHRSYLESRFVEQMQERDPKYVVLGSFDPETLNFKDQLDALARHLFLGAQQMLSDPSLLKDKRFHFVMGTTGVALVFLAVESLLGIVGMTLLLGKGVTALAAVLSPELARMLPLDQMSRLATDAREMLAAVIDKQMRKMVEFYTDAHGRYLEPDDPLLPLLEEVHTECGTSKTEAIK
jgi:hypothetical protein